MAGEEKSYDLVEAARKWLATGEYETTEGEKIDGNGNVIGQTEKKAADLLGGLESGEVLPEKVEEELKKITFLVVEDDPRATGTIKEALEMVRGFKPDDKEKKDVGVVCVESTDDAMAELKAMVEQRGVRKIQIIHDLNLPGRKDGVPRPDMGNRNITKSLNFIDTWNTEHPDDKVDLKIYINSTEMGQRDWGRPEIISQGTISDKGLVVGRIKEDVIKEMPTEK